MANEVLGQRMSPRMDLSRFLEVAGRNQGLDNMMAVRRSNAVAQENQRRNQMLQQRQQEMQMQQQQQMKADEDAALDRAMKWAPIIEDENALLGLVGADFNVKYLPLVRQRQQQVKDEEKKAQQEKDVQERAPSLSRVLLNDEAAYAAAVAENYKKPNPTLTRALLLADAERADRDYTEGREADLDLRELNQQIAGEKRRHKLTQTGSGGELDPVVAELEAKEYTPREVRAIVKGKGFEDPHTNKYVVLHSSPTSQIKMTELSKIMNLHAEFEATVEAFSDLRGGEAWTGSWEEAKTTIGGDASGLFARMDGHRANLNAIIGVERSGAQLTEFEKKQIDKMFPADPELRFENGDLVRSAEERMNVGWSFVTNAYLPYLQAKDRRSARRNIDRGRDKVKRRFNRELRGRYELDTPVVTSPGGQIQTLDREGNPMVWVD